MGNIYKARICAMISCIILAEGVLNFGFCAHSVLLVEETPCSCIGACQFVFQVAVCEINALVVGHAEGSAPVAEGLVDSGGVYPATSEGCGGHLFFYHS